MYWKHLIISACMGCLALSLRAQKARQFSPSDYIEPYQLDVTFNKTTNLVFPGAIASVDKGSRDIMVQRTAGAENILKVKAGTRGFDETNLSVVTSDGKLYSFLVRYQEHLRYLNVTIGKEPVSAAPGAPAAGAPMNEGELSAYAQIALEADKNIGGVGDKSSGMSLRVEGFYVKGGILFCRLRLQNASAIPYDVDQFRFYIRDKKQAKRTAFQEVEIQPAYILGDPSTLKGTETKTLVFAVPKFTIPDGKYLVVAIMEKNGGRHLSLKIKNRKIMKATLLPDL